MCSDLVLRNSKRSRKENGLFFSSLVISIVAFYIILSILHQDVMVFLRKMESDAVNKLMMVIPAFYVMTLGILFCLIYFACKYQLQRRRHEFGVYLMMGMQRGKLFGMLMAEDLVSSALALVVGLPVAVLLSELISLITARLVGMGIVGHQFSLSLPAVGFTVLGFLGIKLAAFLMLSGTISRQEIGALLEDRPDGAKRVKPKWVYVFAALSGFVLLAAACTLAIRGKAWSRMDWMMLTLLIGFVGMLLFFYGMRVVIRLLVGTKRSKGALSMFNFRQIEETVVHQSNTMAVSALLILAALCCFGGGVSIAATSGKDVHVIDYTFVDHKLYEGENPTFANLQAELENHGLSDQFSKLFPMRIGHIHTTEEYYDVFQMESVIDALRQLPQSEDRDVLLNNLSYTDKPYLLCQSDYNTLLEAAGKPLLQLGAQEAAVYMDDEMSTPVRFQMLNTIFATRPDAELDGAPLTGEVQTTDIVTDRSITLSFALILPDDAFLYYTQGRYDTYVNGILGKNATDGISLMNAIAAVNEKLNATGLFGDGMSYESYLQNMGRQLFYMVAASYITIYLALIFLVVANTVLGVQFLMSQRKSGRRYQTLVRLGATYGTLCKSARTQINWFMGLPVTVAAVTSVFGVRGLFSGILRSGAMETPWQLWTIAAAMILVLCVVEWIYMTVVKRSSDRYLLTLMQPQREE